MKRLHKRIDVIQAIVSTARYLWWWAWLMIFGVVAAGIWIGV